MSEYPARHARSRRISAALLTAAALVVGALSAGSYAAGRTTQPSTAPLPVASASPGNVVGCDQIIATLGPDGQLDLPIRCYVPPAETVTETTMVTVTTPVPVTTTVTQTVTQTVTPSPTPPPTTTPPPPPGAYPNATNRGVPAGTVLANDTRCVLATAGEVIVGKHFSCRLSVSATNVVIRNSQLDRGINNWTSGGGHSFVLEDSTVGTAACVGDFGVGATDFVARRVKVTGFTDGLRVSGRTSTPILIEDSYVLTCRSATAHTDGVQADNTLASATIRHNTIDIRPSATTWTAAIFWPAAPPLIADDNILAGGGYEFQIAPGPGPFTLINNKLVNDSWQYGPSNVPCGSTTWANNTAVTLDAAGQPASTVRAVACG